MAGRVIFAGLICSLPAFLFTPRYAVAQAGFEGAVSMTMQANGTTIPVDYEIKGHKARIEMQTTLRTNVILIDLDAGTQTILIPELKAYAVHTGTATTGMSAGATPTLTDLGTSETVAGHLCENYKLESVKYSGTACMTREFGDNPLAEALNGPLGGAMSGDEALKKAGMPLKMKLAFKQGKREGETAAVEVTKVAPGPLSDAQFAVPDGWKKLSGLPGMP